MDCAHPSETFPLFARSLKGDEKSEAQIFLDHFAVELAKITLMLAKELELIEAKKLVQSDQLLIEEKALPLANLNANILCADALFTAWPRADAIIGNPPYLGSRYLAKEHGYDCANKLCARFPGVPKMADFCTHWFRLAHDALPPGRMKAARRVSITSWKTAASSPGPSRPRSGAAIRRRMSAL